MMNKRPWFLIPAVAAAWVLPGPAAAQIHGDADAAPVVRITLQSAKGELPEVLRMVAAQGGLNLVIGPEVKGAVSVYLEDVDVHTALKAIAVNNGFDYTVENGVITVSKPPEHAGDPVAPPLYTRVFEIRCQDAERVRDALEFALTKYGRMKVLNENSDSQYGVQSLTSLAGNFSDSTAGTAVTASATSASGANAAGQVSGRAGLPIQAGVQTPRNARRLIVTDTADNLEQIARLIADLDRLPPQVLIEARILEMSTDLQRQLGIDWNPTILANGPIIDHKWPLNNRAGFSTGAQIPRNISGDPMTRGGMALGTIDFSQFTALVQAHQTDNSIRLLANPRLLVYNNHSASILVGERYPILQATITDFGTVTEAFSEYIPVGVQLEVTPTIMKDGRISMLVHPATSALGDDVIGTTGLRVARIRTRELDTRVIMDDGQTIVLGGLISDRKTHSVEKVPGLGDVPFLDVIFRQENPRSERVDLLVFLTAHVQAATDISDRDQSVYDMYKPHFKHVERLQDVPLHFEIPSEYEPPKPMFSDPPNAEMEEAPPSDDAPATETAPAQPPTDSGPANGTPPVEERREDTTRTRLKAASVMPERSDTAHAVTTADVEVTEIAGEAHGSEPTRDTGSARTAKSPMGLEHSRSQVANPTHTPNATSPTTAANAISPTATPTVVTCVPKDDFVSTSDDSAVETWYESLMVEKAAPAVTHAEAIAPSPAESPDAQDEVVRQPVVEPLAEPVGAIPPPVEHVGAVDPPGDVVAESYATAMPETLVRPEVLPTSAGIGHGTPCEHPIDVGSESPAVDAVAWTDAAVETDANAQPDADIYTVDDPEAGDVGYVAGSGIVSGVDGFAAVASKDLNVFGDVEDEGDFEIEAAEFMTEEALLDAVDGLKSRIAEFRASAVRGWNAARDAEITRRESLVPVCRAQANGGASIHAGDTRRAVTVKDAVAAEEMSYPVRSPIVTANVGGRADASE